LQQLLDFIGIDRFGQMMVESGGAGARLVILLSPAGHGDQ
jgi:hypothetical protein